MGRLRGNSDSRGVERGTRQVATSARKTIYRYGNAAWIWRVLIAAGLVLGGLFFVTALLMMNGLVVLAGLALVAPSVFFGLTLVVRADRHDDGTLEVWTLLFWRRRIHRTRLGPARVRILYRTLYANLNAPRVWLPVEGGLPLYFDLLGNIADRQALLSAIGLRADTIRHAE